MHPKRERHGDHLEAIEQQIPIVGVAAPEEESLDEEEVLEVLERDEHPRVDGLDVRGWVLYVVGRVA